MTRLYLQVFIPSESVPELWKSKIERDRDRETETETERERERQGERDRFRVVPYLR